MLGLGGRVSSKPGTSRSPFRIQVRSQRVAWRTAQRPQSALGKRSSPSARVLWKAFERFDTPCPLEAGASRLEAFALAESVLYCDKKANPHTLGYYRVCYSSEMTPLSQ